MLYTRTVYGKGGALMKRTALINDISGIGRCSLTVALPIISACGHECAVLPTAVLSNHTGFDDYTFYDFTGHMRSYIDCWRKLGVSFDAVYSGFLGSCAQADITLEFMSEFGAGALKLVDPVLGDGGRLYDTCGGKMLYDMKRLAGAADVITPNLTELCALAGADYPTVGTTFDEIERMCAEIGCNNIIVTGLEHETVPQIGGDRIVNLIWDGGCSDITENKRIETAYCGTGDVFASVLCGVLTSGAELKNAVRIASDFVEKCVEDTYKNHGNRLYGIQFENNLSLLKEYLL